MTFAVAHVWRALQAIMIHVVCAMVAAAPVIDDAVRIQLAECEEAPLAPPIEDDEELPISSELSTERISCHSRLLRLTLREIRVTLPCTHAQRRSASARQHFEHAQQPQNTPMRC